jgi:hypothetical protein
VLLTLLPVYHCWATSPQRNTPGKCRIIAVKVVSIANHVRWNTSTNGTSPARAPSIPSASPSTAATLARMVGPNALSLPFTRRAAIRV